MTTITIRNHWDAPYSDDICLDQDGPRAIVHLRGEDCAKVHGLVESHLECSVCGREWDNVPVSVHERCAYLYEDGDRRYADCLVILSNGARLVYE